MSQQARPNTGPNAWAAPALPPASGGGGAVAPGTPATAAAAPGGGTAGGDNPSQIRRLLDSTPLTTLLFLAINVAMYGYQSFFMPNPALFVIWPRAVLDNLELYRMVSSAFLHGSIMHIGMNMMSLYALGANLERYHGTVKMFYLFCLFVLVGGVMYVALAASLALSGAMPQALDSQALGFSGVLFSLAVLESMASPAPTRSVFGVVNVPTKAYPWVLLVLISVIMPGISFMGHLAGLLVGFAYARSWLSFAVPSQDTFMAIEGHAQLSPLKRYGGFCPMQPPVFDIDPAVSAAIAAAIAASRNPSDSV